jgi:uncharacterized membrane protein YcaP (DUF421 family)
MDWNGMLTTDWAELAEIAIRGTLMYLTIFAMLRIWRRGAVGPSTPDVLLIVVIADAAQNGMAGSYQSVPAGLVLVLVILTWSVVLDMVAYRFPRFGRLVEPPATILVKDGVANHSNLRRNLITRGELMTAIHDAGVESLSDVRSAYLEGDGEISVVPREPGA